MINATKKDMKKIKVIQLVEDLKVGGLENVIATIARGLNREKYDLEVWCVARGGEVAEELKKKGIKVKILGIINYHNPLNIIKLALLFKKAKVDILHSHGYFASIIGRVSAIIVGIPSIIVHNHTIFYHLKKRNIIIDKILNLFTKKIIFVSKATRDSFVNSGYKIEYKSVIIYNGSEDFIYQPQKLDEQRKIIMTVASLAPHKGHTYLLKAIQQVCAKMPDVTLWIIGDGPLRKDLEKETELLGISDKVSFLGKKKNISELLSQAMIFVLPSIREGLPVAIIEAMAQGKAVVATNVGGIPEVVVDKVTGYLVLPKDPDRLAIRIITLLKDTLQRKVMGRRGRAIFTEKFRAEIMVENLEKLYQELERNRYGK